MSEPLPAKANLELYRGDTRVWTVVIETNTGTALAPVWQPYDLTDHTLLSQIRTDRNRTEPVVATFTTLATDAPNGVVTLTLPSDQADLLGADGTKLWWDFQTTRTSDAFRRTWLAGVVKVDGDGSDD
jgi:hypothetical protein